MSTAKLFVNLCKGVAAFMLNVFALFFSVGMIVPATESLFQNFSLATFGAFLLDLAVVCVVVRGVFWVKNRVGLSDEDLQKEFQ